jgi:hypothetical protein
MKTVDASTFEAFAAEFVCAYWETVKSRKFSMPPDEPVEETVEELLAAVSHKVEIDSPSTRWKASCKLHMSGRSGDWWDFRFQKAADGWRLVDATARSDDVTRPHDLLDTVYGAYFGPFLRYVTEVADKRTGI